MECQDDVTVTLTATTGFITDGYDTYPNNLYCGWLIDPPGDGVITLTIKYLNTEYGSDGLFIFDGIDDSAPQLAVLHGTNLPSPNTFTSTGGAMFIVFVSNDPSATSYAGFEGEYSSPVSSIDNVVSNDSSPSFIYFILAGYGTV